jgi:hypothetical protein
MTIIHQVQGELTYGVRRIFIQLSVISLALRLGRLAPAGPAVVAIM